ncbi:helix-turn-helix domain-containing protein [Aeromonas sobria]|nr:helix-turn-helix domain-containing protein [Aeromonas sobria]
MITLNTFSGDVMWNDLSIGQLSSSEILVLQLLLNNPDELVSKEELLEAGWPNKFVQQNSLAVAIKKIRETLAFITDEQVIETRHRKGYMLHKSALSKDSIVNESSVNKGAISRAIWNVFHHRLITHDIGPLTINIIFICSFFIVTLWSFFIASLEKPLTCYKLNKSTICGYSTLSPDEKNSFQQYIDISNTEGAYLYGYDKELERLKIYKMD